MTEQVIIIGSGPAGYTAALYAARADLHPLVFAGREPGGQLTTTTDVENYPGFPEGVSGPELVIIMAKQAERFGARIEQKIVTEVDFSERPFKVTVDENIYEAQTVIITTGASAKRLGLENEKKLYGRGVSACATCDAPLFRGKKEVIVVGGGDTAMEESLFLTKFVEHVTIVHRRDAFRASKIMQDRVLKHPKISVIWDSAVEDILDPLQNKVVAVKLKNLKTNAVTEHPCEGVFAAIGHEPNTKIFQGKIELDEKGYIITKQYVLTNVPGVFAAGDVMDPRYRQAVTAAGTGCMAAIEAEKFLEDQES